ncbi:MAG: hypothetical protein VW472_04615, partial [Candidatus Puniceispirillum sp.]
MSMPIIIDHHHTPDPAAEKQAARKKALSVRQKLAQNNADTAVHLAAHVDDLVACYGTGSYAGY